MPGLIPEEQVHEISARADIVELIGSYVNLRKTGNNYRGLCPFHAEKTPSFTVSPEKNIFYCFGCQTGGNIFTFLMRIENLPFVEAVARVAARVGVELAKTPGGRGGRRQEMLRLNQAVSEHYHDLLMQTRPGEEARAYLQDRGIDSSTIDQYKLGYSLDSWDDLVRALKAKRFSLPLACELGLIVARKETGYYDRFRGRLIFPIEDAQGRVLGFGARSLKEEQPKYMNSPDSALYHKGDNLYGMKLARKEIMAQGRCLVVEGYFDFLVLYQHGIRNALASLGTALTARQVELINQNCKKAVLIFDADPAGEKAALRGLELFLATEVDVRVAVLPAGEDPDSFLRKEGKEAFLAAVEGANKPLVDFLVEIALAELDPSDSAYQAKVVERVTPILAKIPDNVLRQEQADRMAELLRLRDKDNIGPAKIFFPHLDRFARRLGAEADRPKARATAPAPAIQPLALISAPQEEEFLVKLMLEDGRFIARAKEEGIADDFSHPGLKKISELLILDYRGGGIDASRVIDRLEEPYLQGLISALAMVASLGEEQEKRFDDCLKRVRLKKLKSKDERLSQAIKEAGNKGDIRLTRRLVEDKGRLKQEIKGNFLGE